MISLDFELFWGLRDIYTLRTYEERLRQTRLVIPEILQLFRKYEMHATWATVGFLFAINKVELLEHVPLCQPDYKNPTLSPYGAYLDSIGNSEVDDLYHYGASLVEQIMETPFQEIGCHTFSHYYCLEGGQTLEAFACDLKSAHSIAERQGLQMRSLVFPRNQVSPDHLAVAREQGFVCYRGNPVSGLYNTNKGVYLVRALRFLDSYLNITGNHCSPLPCESGGKIVNLPASLFLRPVGSFKPLARLAFRRIAAALREAATQGTICHLWWHPHNFGRHPEANLEFLERILAEFARLRDNGQMMSVTMLEAHQQSLKGASPR